MNELSRDISLSNLFTKRSHHMNISIFFLVQNIFHQSPVMSTVILNCHYMVILKKTQISTLGLQLYPGNYEFLVQAYNDATSIPHGYIRVVLTQSTPDSLGITTDLVPPENNF